MQYSQQQTENKEIILKGADIETYTCQNCSSVMRYNIEKEQFMCSSCGTVYDIQTLSDTVKEYDFAKYKEMEKNCVPFEGMSTVSCQNCGFEISFTDKQVAAVCPMCASTQIATVKQKNGIPPEGIIPFKISKNEAHQLFRNWVKSRWFAPTSFKTQFGEGELSGMYLPFWTYDASAFAFYTGKGGKYRKIKKDGKEETVTDWFDVKGMVAYSFDDVLVCATTKGKSMFSHYNTTTKTKPYSTSYLSGYYAELYDIKADTGFEDAKRTMDYELRSLATRKIKKTYDEAKITTLQAKYSNVTFKHILLPVWASAYGYNGHTYNYFINGETGFVSGDRPYSKVKIAVLIGSIIIVVTIIIIIIALVNG